ncbi:MAG: molybdenum cofactor biosynthesis protein MoaB [Solirubrobacteraceae bacterium]|nr:molybdenum cofactor biosynthesis protein MoaB [Solirubrobacteraceae bacterium]
MSESTDQHRAAAAELGPIPVAVVTVSDTRTETDDRSGGYLRESVAAAGHEVVLYRIVPDEPVPIGAALDEALASSARVVLFNGGTGIARRDRTYDVIASSLKREMPGFGELFRMLSWDEVGAAAMLSRATAGTIDDTFVVCMPGSTNAVRLAWEKLLEPELQHLAWEITR